MRCRGSRRRLPVGRLATLGALAAFGLACSPETADAPSSAARRANPYELSFGPDERQVVGTNPRHGFRMAFEDGALRLNPLEPAPGAASSDTLETRFTASVTGLSMRWEALGRGSCTEPVPAPRGPTTLSQGEVRWQRGPGLEEWYRNSERGLEQGFVLHARPSPPACSSDGPVLLDIALSMPFDRAPLASRRHAPSGRGRSSDTMPSSHAVADDVWLPLSRGQRLHYSHLAVDDAWGRRLPAQIVATDHGIALRIDDAQARYPLRIDPLVWSEEQALQPDEPRRGAAFGYSVDLAGPSALVGAISNPVLPEPGALHVFALEEGLWTETQVLHAPDAAPVDGFGWAIARAGSTALVSACFDPLGFAMTEPLGLGVVYVLARGAQGWEARGTLDPGEPLTPADIFGYSVALDGGMAAVGAPREDAPGEDSGAVYVFAGSGEQWTVTQKLVSPDALPLAMFGVSLALDGDTLVVGASARSPNFRGDHPGVVYAYRSVGDSFVLEQRLEPSPNSANDGFGWAVDIEGDRILAGARWYEEEPHDTPGAAYLFEREGGVWTERQKLGPVADPAEPADDAGSVDPLSDTGFGASVALAGDAALVGAHEFGGRTASGAAFAFARTDEGWEHQRTLRGSSADTGASFGSSSSLEWAADIGAHRAIVGAPIDPNGPSMEGAGAAYVFSLTRFADGDPCERAEQCDSRHCVDGVCCDGDCDHGATSDCRACSVAAGAAEDGRCGDVLDGTACDDGIYCTSDDACMAGGCVGGPNPCPGPNDDENCAESCDEASQSCSAYDGDGSPCFAGSCLAGGCVRDDGAACERAADCASGQCVDSVCCGAASCAPYRCTSAGVCATRCGSSSQCTDSYQCSSAGTCVPATPSNRIGDACSCRMGRAEQVTRWSGLVGLFGGLLLVGGRRRRRSRTVRAGRRARPSAPWPRPAVAALMAALLLLLVRCAPEPGSPGDLPPDEQVLPQAAASDRPAPLAPPAADLPFVPCSGDGGSSWCATSPRQRLEIDLTPPRLAIRTAPQGRQRSAEEPGPVTLETTSLSRGRDRELLPRPIDAPNIVGNRASWRRGPNVHEWLENGGRGIEVGLVIAQPPTRTLRTERTPRNVDATPTPRDEPLVVEQTIGGASVVARHDGVELVTPGGAVLAVTDLHVFDRLERTIDSHIEAGEATIRLVIHDEAAAYPVTIDPLIWTVLTQLDDAESSWLAMMGASVALADNTILVGEPGLPILAAISGTVVVYDQSAGGQWQQVQRFGTLDGHDRDCFGWAIAADGDRAIASSAWDDALYASDVDAGAAFLFERAGVGWLERAKIAPPGGLPDKSFGLAVDIEGDRLVIGAPAEAPATDAGSASATGAVHIYRWDGTNVVLEQTIGPSDGLEGDLFGSAVALEGDRLLVGARGARPDGVTATGAAYLFVRDADSWIDEQKLVAPDGAAGDWFGSSVVLRDDAAVVAAPFRDEWGKSAGGAYDFRRTATGWTLLGALRPLVTEPDGIFGYALAASGTRLTVGAPKAARAFPPDIIFGAGRVHVFTRAEDGWDETSSLELPPTEPGTPPPEFLFGYSVAMRDDLVVAGAPAGGTHGRLSGHTYVLGLRLANGDPCTDHVDCASGWCVSGACCESECGVSLPLACQACTRATGSTADGRCTTFEDDAPCDDGVYCNGGDRCTAGVCTQHDGYPCLGRHDGDEDCRESCDETAQSCSAPDDDYVACAGGRCLAGLCAQHPGGRCTNDAECTRGRCVDGICCLRDDCAPFRCGPGGECFQSCTSSNECAEGHQCTSDGRCIAGPATQPSGGCACRAAPGQPPPGGGALLAALLLLVARAR